MQYQNIDEWINAATDAGFDVESWGFCGSKSAHDVNGKIVGEWIAPFDTADGRASGWLDIVED